MGRNSSKLAKTKPRVTVKAGTAVSSTPASKPVNNARKRAYDFSARSLTAKTSPLLLASEKKTIKQPSVFYSAQAWNDIWYLVNKCTKEVGWLGLVETLDSGDYLVTEIFVPEQTVTGAETDIEADAMTALALQLMEEDKDTSKLYYWGHSHVNMGVTPSGQDEEQIDQYLESCDKFIRGIYNKKGESKVDIFDKTEKLIHEACTNTLYMDAERQATLDELIKTNVKNRVYTAPTGNYGGYNARANVQQNFNRAATKQLQEVQPDHGLSDEQIDQMVGRYTQGWGGH